MNFNVDNTIKFFIDLGEDINKVMKDNKKVDPTDAEKAKLEQLTASVAMRAIGATIVLASTTLFVGTIFAPSSIPLITVTKLALATLGFIIGQDYIQVGYNIKNQNLLKAQHYIIEGFKKVFNPVVEDDAIAQAKLIKNTYLANTRLLQPIAQRIIEHAEKQQAAKA